MKTSVTAVVRETEGRQWIDVSTIALLADMSRAKADAADAMIPAWAAVNRQVNCVEFDLVERGTP